jgi:DUF4097 and DUF4098 domain-containing protein YvlB
MLIGLGVVFLLLQSGRLDDQRFWALYGHWWPLVLVAAGVILLAEWALDHYRLRDPNQPPYRRVPGSAAIALLIFLCFAGPIGSHIHNGDPGRFGPGFANPGFFTPDNIDTLLGEKHESDQSLDLAFRPGGSLNIVNPHGDVTVYGTSDDGRVHIAIHKEVYASTDSEADAKAQHLTPSSAASGLYFSVGVPSVDGGRADLVLTVPAAAATTITANRGNIKVSEIKAPVNVTANHGHIDISAITGPVVAHINYQGANFTARSLASSLFVQGRAQDLTLANIAGPVTFSGDFFGNAHLAQIADDIKIHTNRTDLQLARLDGEAEIHGSDLSVSQALGPLILNTNNRNIALDRVAGNIAVTDRNGSIELTAAPALGAINLEDRNGAVRVIMPQHAGFTVQANTANGNIDTDLPLVPQSSAFHSNPIGSARTLAGSIRPGGPTLTITTTNGDISLHTAAVQPIPLTLPAPPKLTLPPPHK